MKLASIKLERPRWSLWWWGEGHELLCDRGLRKLYRIPPRSKEIWASIHDRWVPDSYRMRFDVRTVRYGNFSIRLHWITEAWMRHHGIKSGSQVYVKIEHEVG